MLTRPLHFSGRLSSLPQQLLFLPNVSPCVAPLPSIAAFVPFSLQTQLLGPHSQHGLDYPGNERSEGNETPRQPRASLAKNIIRLYKCVIWYLSVKLMKHVFGSSFPLI